MTTFRPTSLWKLGDIGRKDYSYRFREPWDYGVNTLRNPKLDKAILKGVGAISDGFVSLVIKPNNETPVWMESGLWKETSKLSEVQITPFPQAKAQDLAIKIFLWGENQDPEAKPFISIPFTPTEVDYQPASQLRALNVLGADLQQYHYGGSEDTLSFDVSWVGLKTSTDGSALDKALKVVSLSKGAGWARSTPPVIYLKWGAGTSTPFQDYLFVVEKAPYKPRQFTLYSNKGTKLPGLLKDPQSGVTMNENGFHPMYVQQTITLKRVR